MGKTTQRARQQQVRAGQHPMWARQQRVRARQHSDNTQMGARQPQRARQHFCGGKTTHNGGRTTKELNPKPRPPKKHTMFNELVICFNVGSIMQATENVLSP